MQNEHLLFRKYKFVNKYLKKYKNSEKYTHIILDY